MKVNITTNSIPAISQGAFKVTTGGGSCGAKAPSANQLVDQAAYDAVEEKAFDFDFGDSDFGEEDATGATPGSTGINGAATAGPRT